MTGKRGTPEVRFWPKVQQTDSCWLWIGGLDSKGYGQFRVDSSRKIVAHRFAYMLLIGDVPSGMVLDHLCRVRRCVNPEHLEPVTDAENIRRGDVVRDQCRNGHAYVPENVKLVGGFRKCVTCLRRRESRRREALRAIGGGW